MSRARKNGANYALGIDPDLISLKEVRALAKELNLVERVAFTDKFEYILTNAGLRILNRRCECVKKFAFLGKVPVARGLFIDHISCIFCRQNEFSCASAIG
jgi:hypothetical protein